MSAAPVVVKGGCACNKIRFSSTSYPTNMGHCLCVQCRKCAGAPFQTFASFPRSAFTWLTEPPKYFRSSSFAKRGFCDSCGSSLSFEMDERLDRISIPPSAIDDWEIPEHEKHKIGKPSYWLFSKEKAPWMDRPNDGLPVFKGDNEAGNVELEEGTASAGK